MVRLKCDLKVLLSYVMFVKCWVEDGVLWILFVEFNIKILFGGCFLG